MADAPKKDDKGSKDSKPSGGSKSSGPGDFSYFIGFLVILFILWVLTGGPEKSPESHNNAFINTDFSTYSEPIRGQPGSVTRTIPFLK